MSRTTGGNGEPDYGAVIWRGFLWGAAMAFGTALGGPVVPVILVAAKAVLSGSSDGDNGGSDISG